MRSLVLLPAIAILATYTKQPDSSTIPPTSAAVDHTLTATVTSLDSALFAACNAHDAAALGLWFTPDLEFYHDKTGLTGYDSAMAGFQRLFTQPPPICNARWCPAPWRYTSSAITACWRSVSTAF